MDNEALEMQGENIPGFSKTKEESPAKSKNSLLKFFFLCLVASILTTSLGILVLSLIFGNCPKFPNFSHREEAPGEEVEGEVEGKFEFLHHLSKAKISTYPGGEMRWARYRRDPLSYDDAAAATFGRSLNSRRSQISVGMLKIRPWGLRAPHWHLNANVHGFVIRGSAWIGLLHPGTSELTTYNVTAGQLLFIPQNSLHWLKNAAAEELLLLLFFSTHRELLTLDLDDAFYSLPEDVAARALKPHGGVSFIRTFQKPEQDQAINIPKNLQQLLQDSSFPQSPNSQVWKFFYDLPGSAEFPFPGGIFRWARFRKNATELGEKERIYGKSLQEHEDSLTLGTLRIFGNHLGIPHFHSNANEVGVVLSGCGQVGVTLPDRNSLFSVGIGDVVFFPLGSQHFIQSFCQEDLLLVLAYSTKNELETLRLNQYFPGIPEHILAQLFSKNPAEFRQIPDKIS